MPRAKRRPYDPSAKTYDRRSTDLNLGIRNHMAPIEVDDPMEAGTKLIVMRTTRNDPLAALHVRKQIDEAQYHGGRAFQNDFETAERGPQAIDPSKEHVDGGRPPEPITEHQQKAAKRLGAVYVDLGADGSALTHDVLVHGKTHKQIAEARGLTGERWEKYFGMRFSECLECLAKFYGFAMKRKKCPVLLGKL